MDVEQSEGEPPRLDGRRLWGAGAAAVFATGALALGAHAASDSLPLALGLLLVLSAALGGAGCRVLGAPRSIARLVPLLEQLAAGKAAPRLAARPDDPLAPLVTPLARIAERLAERGERGRAAAGPDDALPGRLASAVAEIERSAAAQSQRLEEATSHVESVQGAIRSLYSEVEGLARSNEESAASIHQMSSSIDQLARTANSLQETVESSTASIHEMSTSIRRVAENSEEVQQIADETALATTEMDRAMQDVGEHVRGASGLTQKVSERAEEGSDAVGATIRGIEKIRDQTLEAKGALETLAVRIGEIGEIATVIGGISDETNLLSLNAAIIAAQAGEHGKAFAVVADQVKTLSRRTSSSAKQIEEMIRAVQAESSNAVRVMAQGIDSVEEGVTRSRVAGEALEVIRASASDASGQVAEIARATEDQARSSKHVASSTQRVSEYVQQISHAMSEQSSASDNLTQNVHAYLDLARQMAQATDEQRSTSRYITRNSQALTEAIRSLQANAAQHEQVTRSLGGCFEGLHEDAQRLGKLLPGLRELAAGLRSGPAPADDGTRAD